MSRTMRSLVLVGFAADIANGKKRSAWRRAKRRRLRSMADTVVRSFLAAADPDDVDLSFPKRRSHRYPRAGLDTLFGDWQVNVEHGWTDIHTYAHKLSRDRAMARDPANARFSFRRRAHRRHLTPEAA